jgi:hypothetical protein
MILNNTLYNGNDAEILLQFNCRNVTIQNNICFALSGRAYIDNAGSNNSLIVVDNNLYYGASTNSPGSWQDSHGRFANPQLENPPSNMQLKSNSPAIDQGAGLGQNLVGELDINGDPRIVGDTIDIGADEFVLQTGISSSRPTPARRSQCSGCHLVGDYRVSIAIPPLNSPFIGALYDIQGKRVQFIPGSGSTTQVHPLIINFGATAATRDFARINVNGREK